MLGCSASRINPLRQSARRCFYGPPTAALAVNGPSSGLIAQHAVQHLPQGRLVCASRPLHRWLTVAAAAKSSSGKGFSGASKDSRSAPVVAPGPTQTREQDAGSQEGAIYARPELYDAAFSYRDFKEEAKFLRDMYKQHAQGVPLSAVLDLGCGPSRHLLGLAKAGVPTCVGVDLSSDMLAYARGLVDKAGLKDAASVTLQQGDMTNFVVPGKEGTFDMAMCLLGTFSHLTENAQAAASFACVFRHLRPGGLFVLELAHPGDLFDGTLIIGDGAKEAWEVPQGKDKKLLIEWGAEFDNFDPETQVLYRTVGINVFQGENVQDSIEEVVPYRQYTVQELGLLCMLSGFRMEALYGEMRLECGLNHEEAYRMVAVMRKP